MNTRTSFFPRTIVRPLYHSSGKTTSFSYIHRTTLHAFLISHFFSSRPPPTYLNQTTLLRTLALYHLGKSISTTNDITSIVAHNGPAMAALLVACGACLADKFSKKRQARREREADYAAHFEELKAENARRVSELHGLSTGSRNSSFTPEMGEPPKYDAIDGTTGQDFAPRPRPTRVTTQMFAPVDAMEERGRTPDRNSP